MLVISLLVIAEPILNRYFIHIHPMVKPHSKAIRVCHTFLSQHIQNPSSFIVFFQAQNNRISSYLGGAAIRNRDNTLIGIGSHVFETTVPFHGKHLIIQGITNVQFFFDWITEKTGLELPVC